MDSLDEMLAERLTRLEGGEALEACLAGLPEDEALLVKKAALLRAVRDGSLASERALAQRRNLINFAKEKRKMETQSHPHSSLPRPRWFLPVAALSGIAAVVVLYLVITSLASGPAGLWPKSDAPQVAQVASPASASGATQPAIAAVDAQSAVLSEALGIVEVLSSDGKWAAAKNGQAVKAGQHVRTGGLSSVTLGFYDGSLAHLGPKAELSIDRLDAQKSGPRVVMLSQVLGESKHDVAKSSDPASHYEVHTPSGVGAAKGTSFRVFVTAALLVRFDVDEGAVAVTNLNQTLVVAAGQSTVIASGGAPSQPVFRISGTGQVEQTGQAWQIAGRTFRTDASSVFVGQAAVGDLVSFEALIATDVAPTLTRVVLISSQVKNIFTFSGKVESLGAAGWKVAGRALKVDNLSQIDDGIQVGDLVEVEGSIAKDGTILALRIHLVDRTPFEFSGVVEAISGSAWKISGISIKVNADTRLGSGLAVGSAVSVYGRILAGGDWLAGSIQAFKGSEGKFVLTGKVDSSNPWKVGGVAFVTDQETEMEDQIKAGDLVRVEGRILDNGTWVAAEIDLLEKIGLRPFKISGLVSSTNPWKVNGIVLAKDEHTVLQGQIAVGDFVTVTGVLMPDGSWLAKTITVFSSDRGCLSYSIAVRQVDDKQIVLSDWHVVPLGKGILVKGQVKIASVIFVSGCTQKDGGFRMISILVIYQLDSLPVIIVPRDHQGDEDDDHD